MNPASAPGPRRHLRLFLASVSSRRLLLQMVLAPALNLRLIRPHPQARAAFRVLIIMDNPAATFASRRVARVGKAQAMMLFVLGRRARAGVNIMMAIPTFLIMATSQYVPTMNHLLAKAKVKAAKVPATTKAPLVRTIALLLLSARAPRLHLRALPQHQQRAKARARAAPARATRVLGSFALPERWMH